jgi:hypothetical protein
MSISFVSFILYYILSPFIIQQTFVYEILNEIRKGGYSIPVTPFFLNKNRSDSTSANIKDITRMITDIIKISVKEYKIFNQRALQKYKEEF